jgi:hypothetical protein
MALLAIEAKKLSNNQLVAGIIEEIIFKDEFFARLPFTTVNGKAYVYNRENTISEATFLDPYDTITEEASTFTEITTNLRVLIGDVDVDKFIQTTLSDTNNQRAVQISQKAKGLGMKFKRTLMIGDNSTNAKEFDGIKRLVTAAQTISAGTNGNAISYSMLDQLVDAVPNGPDLIMMTRSALRAYRALLRTQGGSTSDSIIIGNFGQPIIAHNGVPIIINDYMPVTETQGSNATTCSIYAMRLNESDGLHGIVGGEAAGITYEDIGTVQNKDVSRSRIKWYTGLALKSTRSLARIQGITNV